MAECRRLASIQGPVVRIVLGAAAALAVAVAAIAYGPTWAAHSDPAVGVAAIGLAWTAFAAGAWCVRRLPGRRAVPLILAGGLMLQLAAVGGPPRSSDDLYRYVWDGRVEAAGIDPYRYAPAAPELAGLRDPFLWPDHANWCITQSTVDQVAPLYDGWDRVLRTLLESAALLRLDGVLPLVDRIADGNERAGALAGVAAVSEPEMASRLRQTAIATLDVLAAPVHSPSGAQRRSAPPSPLTPRALLTAARSRWSEAMELLERSAHPLVERWGVDLIEGLDTAVARARAFGD